MLKSIGDFVVNAITNVNVTKTITNYGRFGFLNESLNSIDQNEETRRPDFPFSGELSKRRYPIRALRYWWLDSSIQRELKRLGGKAVIADCGCDRGIIKRFVEPGVNTNWIGLDMDTGREGIGLAKYDELVKCNFSDGLPLPDSCVDIAICSHVLEHLPDPGLMMSEIARILRPGGLALIGVPTAPIAVALLREMRFRHQLKSGKRKLGQHIHVFWKKRLRNLAESAGFDVEFCTGTALIRKKGSRLEDYAAWIRFNQFGASLIPAMGQELCMQIRKPSAS